MTIADGMRRKLLRPWWAVPLLAAAMLSWTQPCAAEGVSVSEASWKDKAQAKRKYKLGKTAFDGGKFEDALKHFSASYDVVASPNSHLMVARAMIKLGRKLEGYRELDAVILEAEAARKINAKYGKTAEAARAEKTELEKSLAFLTIDMSASATVAGKDVATAQWGQPIPLLPGDYDVVLRTKAGGETSKKLTLKPGEKVTVSPDPPKAVAPVQMTRTEDGKVVAIAPPEPGVRYGTLAWISGGVGVAGLAAFTVFGLVNNAKYDDIKSECTGNRCPERMADNAETGRTYQTLANVGLGVGIVGIGTAAVLWLTAPASPRTESEVATSQPRVVVGPRFVSVSGEF